MAGYAGDILRVDLSTGRVAKEPLDLDLARAYVGGWGINTRLAYDLIKPGTDALSAENPITIGVGLLAGTLAPGAPKVFATSKCAATGTISHAVGSGYFGPMLKWAGYDHLIISGKADRPVYLKVFDDDVEICDAQDLWGLDIQEATKELWRKHGRNCSIACIGPAGENLVKIAILLLDGYITFGRTFGANFGSKKLKAIVVRGTKGLKVSDPDRFMAIVHPLIERGMNDPNRDNWRNLGLFFVLPAWLKAGHRILGHGTETADEARTMEVYGPEQYLKVRQRILSCPACLACDKAVIELKEGEYAGLVTPLSTPLAIADAQSYGIESINRGVKLCDVLNRSGIDSATFSRLFDWAVNLYEHGIINADDTHGLELKMGDFDTVLRLAKQTERREGFGDVLAQGLLGAMERIGRGSENYAQHVKGIGPDFDARVSFGVETFGLITNPRPSYDMPVGGLTVAMGRKPEFFAKVAPGMGFPEEVMGRVFTPGGFDLGRFTAHYENWGNALNCFGVCFRMQNSRLYTADILAELYSAATGMDLTAEKVIEAADRAYNLSRVANAREGFSRKDDRFPEIWFQPLRHAGQELTIRDYFTGQPLSRQDIEKIFDAYYEEKGWDVASGLPTREKLVDLGLEDVAQELEKR